MDAATAFEHPRLSKVSCGLDHQQPLLVPYAQANSPRAWVAASASILAVHLFLGVLPDAPAAALSLHLSRQIGCRG